MTAKLDVDYVSDQDYLKEFRDGIFGYDQTKAYYLTTFGRDIDDYTDPIRQNRLNVNRLWTYYALNADVRWYEDANQYPDGRTGHPLQNLPDITFAGVKNRIAGSPFYYDLFSEYTYLYQDGGPRGQRAELYPRVYYPRRFFKSLFVEPSAGLRETAWHVDHFDSTATDEEDRDAYRSIYDLKLDTSTYLYRLFNIDLAGYDRLKHSLKPQVVYTYVPNQNQSDIPVFDEPDYVPPQNRITYSLTQTLTARKPRLAPPPDSILSNYTYNPFLRFYLEQSYDVRQYDFENAGTALYSNNASNAVFSDQKPFSDIYAELDLVPGRYIGLNADTLWSPYSGQFNAYRLSLNTWDNRGDRLYTYYRYARETAQLQSVNSITLAGALTVTRKWLLRGLYSRDIVNSQLIESSVGITYQSQCWAVDVDYQEEVGNHSFKFMVRLAGLGNLGG